jgi:hypothetical protein
MSVEKIESKTPRQIAEAELREEKQKTAVAKMKTKLRELDSARQIVKNLEAEVEELEREIAHGL